MLQLTFVLLPARTSGRPVREVALQDATVVHGFEWYRGPHPVDELLAGNKVDVRQSQDRVDELEETLLAMGSIEEPGRVEE